MTLTEPNQPVDDAVELEAISDDVEKGEKEKLKYDSDETSQASQNGNVFVRILIWPVLILSTILARNKVAVKYAFYGLLVAGYLAYFIAALCYDISHANPLMILTVVVLVLVIYELFSEKIFETISKKSKSCCQISKDRKTQLTKYSRYLVFLICIGFILWIIIDILRRNPVQLVSLVGFIIILLICIWGSKYPKNINWRPVIWGIALQFIFGLLILRTSVGYDVIKFVGDQVAIFMRYSDYGSSFVFGKEYQMHYFAFKVLPMIIFFSTVMNMLYYLGLMQWFIGKLAYFTQITLGTSAIESAVAIANIFVGMTEAPLVVRPYLSDLTAAEIHSVLTAGLGSIAFSVFGVFVDFGVDGVHLLTACVMSAPASLVISRMLYPERQKSKFMNTDSLKLEGGTNRNIVEAAAAGASMSIKLVANIGANLIAFLALLAFIDAVLAWFGAFVGLPDFSFGMICSYLFMPVAFLLGADWEDSFLVGQLFGTKTFLNEFIAYKDMKPYIAHRLAGGPKYIDGVLMSMSERSEVIAIHALCGFCNVSSLGIVIGGLSVLMPSRKKELANLAMRSLFGGILTCCMTASIAGLLFIESDVTSAGDATTAAMNISATTAAFG